ncbi:MAG: DNA alkylation repair protein [Patescibacteria group bacterium]
MLLNKIKKDLEKFADPKQAKNLQRFFKTGKGEYGEGDVFIGLRVPQIRKIVSKYYKEVNLKDVEKLLHSEIHEYRMAAALFLLYKFKNIKKIVGAEHCSAQKLQKEIFDLYLKNTKYINNWDLVDVTTPGIVGEFLLDKDRKILYKLVKSKSLWERRIGVMATFTFIRENDYKDGLKISEMLLNDEHDLIHKAVGWMLREVGNRDLKTEEKFLHKYSKKMPRTMLRYSIEKFPEKKRKAYLSV